MRMPEKAWGGTRAVVSRSMMNKGHAWCLWVHRLIYIGNRSCRNKGAMGQFPRLALARGMTACRGDMSHSAPSCPAILLQVCMWRKAGGAASSRNGE